MLEAAYYDAIYIVSPFIGALIDNCCSEEDDAPITMSFSILVELMTFIYRRGMDPTWNEEELTVF